LAKVPALFQSCEIDETQVHRLFDFKNVMSSQENNGYVGMTHLHKVDWITIGPRIGKRIYEAN